MRDQNCPVCEVPMTTVQVIGDGVDDVVLFRCPNCRKEVFVGYFRFAPPAINGESKVRTVGFGDAPTSSGTSHKGGVW